METLLKIVVFFALELYSDSIRTLTTPTDFRRSAEESRAEERGVADRDSPESARRGLLLARRRRSDRGAPKGAVSHATRSGITRRSFRRDAKKVKRRQRKEEEE